MASKPTKTVRHQKFLTEYTAKWDFIVPSVKGETYRMQDAILEFM